MNRVRRAANLDLRGHLRIAMSPDSTATTHRAVISELSARGAMVVVDVPAKDRLGLFNGIRSCVLEFEDPKAMLNKISGKTVYLQPQTSAGGDYVTFKIGLVFEGLSPQDASWLETYAAEASQKANSWFTKS